MHWLDPDYLPETSGKVTYLLMNPHGELDGLILDGRTEVHFPPHMSAPVANLLKVGERVSVHAVRPKKGDVLTAISLEVGRKRIVDDGPPEKSEKKKKAKDGKETEDFDAEGIVERAIHGPRGETHGLLMADGRIVRFPKHAEKHMQPYLKPKAKLAVRGHALTNRHGTVIDAREVGRTHADLEKLPKKPHAKPHGHHP